MTKVNTFLPLGSAIKIEDDAVIYIVISRAFMQTPDGEILSGYQCVPHPIGNTQGKNPVIIRETEIIEVVHPGYSDDKDTEFIKVRLEELQERIENQANAPASPVKEEPKEKVLSPEELLEKDPFYKFRK